MKPQWLVLVALAAAAAAFARIGDGSTSCGMVLSHEGIEGLRPIPANVAHSRSAPTAVVWREGLLWVADPNTTIDRAASVQCYCYKQKRTFISWFDHMLSRSGRVQLVNPSSLAYTSLGLWISDTYSGSVHLVDVRGEPAVRRTFKLSSKPENTIGDLEPAADGGVYALSGTDGTLTRIAADGTTSVLQSSTLIGSEGMTIRSRENATSLLVAKPMTGEVAEVRVDGQGAITGATVTIAYRNIARPVDVAADSAGNLLVLEAGGRVLVANKDASRLRQLCSLREAVPGKAIDAFRIAVSVPGTGNRLMAVTDPTNGYVYVKQY